MIRIKLDLGKLPSSKYEQLLKVMDQLLATELNELIKGLVYLGHVTIKQADLKEIANISRGSNKYSYPVRVCINNQQLLKLLATFDSAASRRNFIYALLYSGLNYFLESIEKKNRSQLELQLIEKNIFLSGLSLAFESVKATLPTKVFNKPVANESKENLLVSTKPSLDFEKNISENQNFTPQQSIRSPDNRSDNMVVLSEAVHEPKQASIVNSKPDTFKTNNSGSQSKKQFRFDIDMG